MSALYNHTRTNLTRRRSFWRSTLELLNPPPSTKARFLTDMEAYLRSLPEEAADRDSRRLRGLEDHFKLRHQTGCLLPSFDFVIIPFDLSDEVADHPHIKRMTLATAYRRLGGHCKRQHHLSRFFVSLLTIQLTGCIFMEC